MAQLRLAIRSSYGLNAYRALGYPVANLFYNSSVNAAPTVATPGGLSGVFGGGQIIDLSATTSVRGITYGTGGNVGPLTGFSVLARIVPKWTGTPPTNQCVFSIGGWGANDLSAVVMYILNNGQVEIDYFTSTGNLIVNADFSGITFTAGVATDIMFSWDGTTGAGKMKVSQDGVLITAIDVPSGWGVPDGKFKPEQMTTIYIGSDLSIPASNFYLNEFLIFDYGVNPVYATRTDFWPTTRFDYTASTDPGVAHVEQGVAYDFQGTDLVGTLGPFGSTDPGASNVRDGVNYSINGTSETGTLTVPGASTDPGVTHVEDGVTYEIDGVSKTGTLVSTDPGEANVSTGVDYVINNIDHTGTRDTVTNIISGATLKGGQLSGILKGEA